MKTVQTNNCNAPGTLPFTGLKPLTVVGLTPGASYVFQITGHNRLGIAGSYFANVATTLTNVTLAGPAMTYYVSPAGSSTNSGATNSPVPLQYALDMALPGDDIRLLPGTYYGGFILAHGGCSNAPITIEADQPGTAALNGGMSNNCALYVTAATNVIIRGLGIQWVSGTGLELLNCRQIEVCSNTFFDSYITSWDTPDATGLDVAASPSCAIHHNVFYNWWVETEIFGSTNTCFYNNTAVGGARTCLQFYFGSAAGSVITNNSLNCYSDHAIELCGTNSFLAQSNDLTHLILDFNNYGTRFQSGSSNSPVIPIANYPGFGYSRELAKWYYIPGDTTTCITYTTLANWITSLGKDNNSIFADPQWLAPQSADFRLQPGSTNLLSNGNYIGAYGTNGVIYLGHP